MSFYGYNEKEYYNQVSKELTVTQHRGDYQVDPVSELSYYENPAVKAGNVQPFPGMMPNGGMYSGESCTHRAHIPNPVVHTGTYFHQILLSSAKPPPGAQEQYVGTNRVGNHFGVMPGVNWYNPEMTGPFEMKVTQKK